MFQRDSVIGDSPRFQQMLATAHCVATSNSNVLITGESGTGKEIIAKCIHDWSPRALNPFVAINCSAIPENLLESELYGYAKGAFTGAHISKPGLFEVAAGGTMFLDEIGDMPWGLQAKLLRVLQERKIKRIGENHLRDIDIRVVAATHKNLKKAVSEREFREDLFFRLNVVPLEIPSLRERREDILPLAQFFLKRYSSKNGKGSFELSTEAQKKLMDCKWVGNVRELENAMERVVVLSEGLSVGAEDLEFLDDYKLYENSGAPFSFADFGVSDRNILPIEEMNLKYIQYVLTLNKGAKNKTARELGIDRKTLYRKLNLQ
ncbi:MAG: sigma-54-dependent Fis family transcriptional regulator [Bdellovibrionaceae bacterium]|nr:sigma-54-dependent Fis family transcriptional regulator [Pseudobdellovibrionaceae bacterium]